ncbi:MAG TPA: hypothetical protein VGJ77_02595 [Gaiellaceae bacterium]
MRRLAAAVAVAAAGAAVALAANERPDPATQAEADGCKRDVVAIVKREAPNWVYVGDRSAPADTASPAPRWLRGVVDGGPLPDFGAYPTVIDQPTTHTSYDFVVNVKPDAQDEYLMGGDSVAKTGNFRGADDETGRVHTERESSYTPAWVWPDRGDRVTMLGSWAWDCDHFEPAGEHTEFHPWRALWLERRPGRASPTSPRGEAEGDLLVSSDATPAGRQEECAHLTKADPAAFKACVTGPKPSLDVNGDYAFTVRAPPRPPGAKRLVVRVVDRGSVHAPPVSTRAHGGTVDVRFRIAARPGDRVVVAKKVYAGWTPMPARLLPLPVRLTVERVLVRRAMDPSTAQESTRPNQNTTAPGEFVFYWNVAGVWARFPRTVLARDGQMLPLRQTIDAWLARGEPFRFFAVARECDFGAVGNADGPGRPVWPCPRANEVGNFVGDDGPGVVVARFASPRAAAGRRSANAGFTKSSCPASNRSGCYRLTWSVRVGSRP